jgi:hypothetical protein
MALVKMKGQGENGNYHSTTRNKVLSIACISVSWKEWQELINNGLW